MEKDININLRVLTRDEIEEGLIDIIRFERHHSYLNEQSLKYFKDAYLRQLFVNVFWNKPENIIEVLETAVSNYPGAKYRIEQVRDLILKWYVRDGKLIL